MKIIGEMEPCQYENTDIVMGLLRELYDVRTTLEKNGQTQVLAKIDGVIANLEAVDNHNSHLERSLLEYRALKRQSPLGLVAPNL